MISEISTGQLPELLFDMRDKRRHLPLYISGDITLEALLHKYTAAIVLS